MGYVLLGAWLAMLGSGLLLTRLGPLEVRDSTARSVFYWTHVVSPLFALWSYWVHRLAGPPIKWNVGIAYLGLLIVVGSGSMAVHAVDSRDWCQAASPAGAKYFEPSLAKTSNGKFISAAGIDSIHENQLTGDKLPETIGGGCAFFDYDYDNDGDSDVFVAAVGMNAMLRNEDGRFVDLSAETGVKGAKDAWSTSAGFFGYDNNGDLDLFVGNYVTWSPQLDLDQDFRLTGLGRAYGPPRSFAGSQRYLYRSDGAAGFAEVSKEAGLHENAPASEAGLAKSLGVLPCDVNRDGTFTEAAVVTGLAYDTDGKARGAMGIDAAALGEDGELAIAIGNFANEMTAFYISADRGRLFADDAVPIGIGPKTRLDLTSGLFFFDADLDGRLDLFSANGHIEDEINRVQAGQHYRRPPSLFWNGGQAGGAEFLRVSDAGDLERPLVGRGASYADIDGDGDHDVLVTQVKGPPAVLRNDLESRPHFLRLKLVGTDANRDAMGARVTVAVGDRKVVACVAPTRSYLSQVELPVTIGLGVSDSVDTIEIAWPGGQRQVVDGVQLDREIIVKQATQ